MNGMISIPFCAAWNTIGSTLVKLLSPGAELGSMALQLTMMRSVPTLPVRMRSKSASSSPVCGTIPKNDGGALAALLVAAPMVSDNITVTRAALIARAFCLNIVSSPPDRFSCPQHAEAAEVAVHATTYPLPAALTVNWGR